jgi:hypothetical protein
MCLPVSRLFWVSFLAYPNLLGTKGYVVVVVVVVENINWKKDVRQQMLAGPAQPSHHAFT